MPLGKRLIAQTADDRRINVFRNTSGCRLPDEQRMVVRNKAMELVTGFSAPSRLESLNREAMAVTTWVEAAIAYATDERSLIQSCMQKGVKLKLWARYDYSMQVWTPPERQI
jgi:hypothetical protein